MAVPDPGRSAIDDISRGLAHQRRLDPVRDEFRAAYDDILARPGIASQGHGTGETFAKSDTALSRAPFVPYCLGGQNKAKRSQEA